MKLTSVYSENQVPKQVTDLFIKLSGEQVADYLEQILKQIYYEELENSLSKKSKSALNYVTTAQEINFLSLTQNVYGVNIGKQCSWRYPLYWRNWESTEKQVAKARDYQILKYVDPSLFKVLEVGDGDESDRIQVAKDLGLHHYASLTKTLKVIDSKTVLLLLLTDNYSNITQKIRERFEIKTNEFRVIGRSAARLVSVDEDTIEDLSWKKLQNTIFQRMKNSNA